MHRRDLARLILGAVAGTAIGKAATGQVAQETSRNRSFSQMHLLDDQFDGLSVEETAYLQRQFVRDIEIQPRKRAEDGAWDLDDLKRLRELADRSGLTIRQFSHNRIRPSEFKTWRLNDIMAGNANRDREIDVVIGNIRKAAAIGVPMIRYHWKLTDDYRNDVVKTAGGNSFTAWRLPSNWRSLPMTEAGRVPLELFWERMRYFLERIMPVAEEHKVRIACHPPDPPLPPGYRGVDTWNYDMFEGLKTYASLTDSPNFGFLLCVGTVGEGLVDPSNDEVTDIVRYFGERKKIFAVHLRNIRGKRDSFSETYPDQGDMDFYRVMKALRQVEYPYSIVPDHMPDINDESDPMRKQVWAYGYGYIRAMIQAVNARA